MRVTKTYSKLNKVTETIVEQDSSIWLLTRFLAVIRKIKKIPGKKSLFIIIQIDRFSSYLKVLFNIKYEDKLSLIPHCSGVYLSFMWTNLSLRWFKFTFRLKPFQRVSGPPNRKIWGSNRVCRLACATMECFFSAVAGRFVTHMIVLWIV